MKRDFLKRSEFLAKNAREGVIVENMILEWKLTEQRINSSKPEEQQTPAKGELVPTLTIVAGPNGSGKSTLF